MMSRMCLTHRLSHSAWKCLVLQTTCSTPPGGYVTSLCVCVCFIIHAWCDMVLMVIVFYLRWPMVALGQVPGLEQEQEVVLVVLTLRPPQLLPHRQQQQRQQ